MSAAARPAFITDRVCVGDSGMGVACASNMDDVDE